MANPLHLPRALVLVASIGAFSFAAVAISQTYWKIAATVTTSDFVGLSAGQTSWVNFKLNKYVYYSDLSVNSSGAVVVQGSQSYSSVDASNIQDVVNPILALVIVQLVVAVVFSVSIAFAWTKKRVIFQRRWIQNVLVVASLAAFACGIASLALITEFPSAVNDDYAKLFSSQTAVFMPSFNCNSNFTVGGLDFDGEIPTCSSVWSTSSFALSTDTISVVVTLSLNTGSGWWWNVAATFCTGAICLFFIPGKTDLFLERIVRPGEEEKAKNELQQLKESDRSEEDVEAVEDVPEHNNNEEQIHIRKEGRESVEEAAEVTGA